MRLPVLFALFTFLLPAAASAQRGVWFVAPGGGGHFATLQAAADAVAANDILLLRPGSHGSLVTGKPLCVIGSGPLTHIGGVRLSGLPSNTSFVLVDVALTGHASIPGAIAATACAGRIVLLRTQISGQPSCRFVDCSEVDMVDCSVFGRQPAYAQDSSIRMAGCTILGPTPEFRPDFGTSAVDLLRSRVWLVATHCRGGEGNVASGYAVQALDSQVVFGPGCRLDASGIGTWRSLNLNWSTAQVDPIVQLFHVDQQSSSLTRPFLPAVTGQARWGGSASATMQSRPGGIAVLGIGRATRPVVVAGVGELGIDPGSPTWIAALSGPALTIGATVPLDLALVGAEFATQGLVIDAAGRATLSNRVMLVIH